MDRRASLICDRQPLWQCIPRAPACSKLRMHLHSSRLRASFCIPQFCDGPVIKSSAVVCTTGSRTQSSMKCSPKQYSVCTSMTYLTKIHEATPKRCQKLQLSTARQWQPTQLLPRKHKPDTTLTLYLQLVWLRLVLGRRDSDSRQSHGLGPCLLEGKNVALRRKKRPLV